MPDAERITEIERTHPHVLTDLHRMTPAQHLAKAHRDLNVSILACPSGPERDALTEANMVLMAAL